MVNEKISLSTRSCLLDILRNSSDSLSGEKIAEKIGVSRVAVWKTIQSLNASGYRIASAPLGYHLEQDIGDSLFPWEFGSGEDSVRHWDSTDSTMNRAREAALSGASDGLVLIAERQSDGRGTGSKKWESAPGGLFFTLITRPNLNQAYAHRQVLAAQCAMVRSIRELTGIEAQTAWPNDILIPGANPLSDSTHTPNSPTAGKAGGILCETLTTGNSISFLNLGIGINTGTQPSLSGTTHIASGRKELLQTFLREFEKHPASDQDLVSHWNSLSATTGKTVRYCDQQNGKNYQGLFTGLDPAGWAIIVQPENSTSENHFPPGSISIVNKGSNV